jgi:exodeoxyribonuclease VII large subunit
MRWPLYPLRFVHTSVQGVSAAPEIADAIRRLDRSGVDVIVVIRGGGSMEDLWCFNELPVAEAIFATNVPVVSGVGHETDFTLADFVADRRAHTPTDAAQTVIPDRAAILAALERAAAHLEAAIDGALTARAERLAGAARSPVLRSSAGIFGERARVLGALGEHARLLILGRLERARSRLESAAARARAASPLERFLAREKSVALLAVRIRGATARAQERVRSRLALAAARLEAISPLAVLARGYSITRRTSDGSVLKSSAALAPGESLETLLAAGAVHSRVERVVPPDSSTPSMDRGGRA